MYKKILIPLDGTRYSEAIIPHAQVLANHEGAEIVLLTVPLNPSIDFINGNPGLTARAVEETEIASGRYLDEKVADLKKKGARVTGLLREGPIPEAILSVAEEIHADMIAMATHGRTGVKRWLLGSVADEVIHSAHVPVILVHPN
jgi:nucleotide-binding universal stress UspA family protein